MPPQLEDLPFNTLDLVLAAIALLALWRGWRTGFLITATRLACLAASLLAAEAGYPALARAVQNLGWIAPPWAAPAAFVAIFVVAQLLLGGLAWQLLRPLLRRMTSPWLRGIDSLLGLLPGAVSAVLCTMFVVVLMGSLPLGPVLAEQLEESALADPLQVPIAMLEDRIEPVLGPALALTARTLTAQPEPHQSIALPFTVAKAQARPALEAQMLELLNAERERAGLRPLAADPDTVEVSRAHGRDMFARHYFSHETPEGATPFDRLRQAGIRFRAAGENLALAPTLERAHQGLMDSPGHRANILNPLFGRVGIGIVDGGRHGLIVTQTFRN
ncbi:hypothetical protein GT347_20870 [Xylophilus rhododendri]|uniref:SCP domain-containing protein n=1 Tax=Xylophilus rhododendri TaxID=2697032 RepID=A0A857JBZ2_9BURK|nr:CvpA family protein [Xylophilus rhododendri]QHJ00216.1 hypothetical protein GT347_20870 [Xylophilus rhododendri]